jgi:hypothetical protein
LSLIGEKLDLKNSYAIKLLRLQHMPVQVASKEFVEMELKQTLYPQEQAYMLYRIAQQNASIEPNFQVYLPQSGSVRFHSV